MKKPAVLLIGAAALFAAAALHFGWAEKWMPALWVEIHERSVHDRAEEFLQCLVDDDLERCVELTDPDFVREQGEFATKTQLGFLMLLADAVEFTTDRVQLGDVELSEDHQTATIDVSAQRKGVSTPATAWKWVRVDGEWYYSP